MEKIRTLVEQFGREEDGAVMTEYLVVLGLITAVTILAIINFGEGLAGVYDEWTTWIGDNLGPGDGVGG